jgi:DNA-binding SARP family transcriptional activator
LAPESTGRIGRPTSSPGVTALSAPPHNRVIAASSGLNPLRLKTFGGLSLDRPDAGSDAGLRPRSLALLAILAAAGPKGATRDRVLTVLWPEADEDRARHALSQALYSLRRDLGGDVVLTTPTLRLDPERITADVIDFRAAVARARRVALTRRTVVITVIT